MTSPGTVCVTGASGYMGTHAVVRLLSDGYVVRGSLRSLEKEAALREVVRKVDKGRLAAVADDPVHLSFFAATLESADGWDAGISGCDYVLHIASPVPAVPPKTADEIVKPAVAGVLNVLRAASRAGVRRVVLTSSCGAVFYGLPLTPGMKPFDETSWTNVKGPDVPHYIASKALAERAAWDFIGKEGTTTELAVVCPTITFGEVLGNTVPSSATLVDMMMQGKVPRAINMFFVPVGVKDVIDLHIRAMLSPAAKGERFIASSGGGKPLSMLEISAILKAHLGPKGSKLPTKNIPDWIVRFAAFFSLQMKTAAMYLGKVRPVSSEKAIQLLGWTPASPAQVFAETADSLLRIHGH